MPFTPSHAVVALPFIRTPLVPAAVAVGAMAPDLPLFVRGVPLHYGRTHDLAWLPVTIVLGLALLLLWRCALRPSARELSPSWLAARLPCEWDRGAARALRDTMGVSAIREPGGSPRRNVPWRSLLVLVLSLAIGVVSHIVWDLFTHEGRAGVALVPVLAEPWGPLAGFRWLQHGSSILGLSIIVIWMLVWLVRRRPTASVSRLLPDSMRWVWWLSLPAFLIGAWMLGIVREGPLDADLTFQQLAYRVLPPACALWGAVSLALAIGVQLARGRRPAHVR